MPKTNKSAKSAAPAASHAVPMPNPATPAKAKTSIIDRFRAKTAPTTVKVKEDDRPVVPLDPNTEALFVQYAAAAEVFARFEERKDGLSEPLIETLFNKYVDALWNSKRRPQNPNIKAYADGKLEATGMFTVTAGQRLRVPMPPVNPGEPLEDAMIRSLTAIGMSRVNAALFVNEEISFVPKWDLNFTESLQADDDNQRTAAEVLFCVINGEDAEGNALDLASRLSLLESISENGWDALRDKITGSTAYVPSLKDGDGFLDRVCMYVDSRNELGKLLALFKPVKGFRSVKFAVSDTETDKNQKLLAESKSVIGA